MLPFISETGYRSHFAEAMGGCPVDEAARRVFASILKSEGRRAWCGPNRVPTATGGRGLGPGCKTMPQQGKRSPSRTKADRSASRSSARMSSDNA